jgi:hypothetical protein
LRRAYEGEIACLASVTAHRVCGSFAKSSSESSVTDLGVLSKIELCRQVSSELHEVDDPHQQPDLIVWLRRELSSTREQLLDPLTRTWKNDISHLKCEFKTIMKGPGRRIPSQSTAPIFDGRHVVESLRLEVPKRNAWKQLQLEKARRAIGQLESNRRIEGRKYEGKRKRMERQKQVLTSHKQEKLAKVKQELSETRSTVLAELHERKRDYYDTGIHMRVQEGSNRFLDKRAPRKRNQILLDNKVRESASQKFVPTTAKFSSGSGSDEAIIRTLIRRLNTITGALEVSS